MTPRPPLFTKPDGDFSLSIFGVPFDACYWRTLETAPIQTAIAFNQLFVRDAISSAVGRVGVYECEYLLRRDK